MAATVDSSKHGQNGQPAIGMLWLGIVALVVGLLAVSGQSYWIDEGSTVEKAIQPTVAGWWQHLRAEGTSNLQLPLYLLYAWAWEKPFGQGEWALRAGNAPWFLLGVVAFGFSLPGSRKDKCIAALALLANAFAWYYVNEARPYAMQLGAAFLVFLAFIKLAPQAGLAEAEVRKWTWALVGAGWVLAASGMLAMIWLGGGFLAAGIAYGWQTTRERLLQDKLAWGMAVISLGALGGYYLWTLTLGARATNIASTDWKSLMYIPYEMFGFSGLGPSRLVLRTAGLRVLKPYIPLLAGYAVLLAIVLWNGWSKWRANYQTRTLAGLAVGLGGVVLFLVVVGVKSNFRVLGRHFTPLLPVLLYPVGLGLAGLWQRGAGGRLITGGFIAASLLSCGVLRFGAAHARDDYRGAAAIAREALKKGEKVWWSAADQCAIIYGLDLSEGREVPGKALLVIGQPKGFEAGLAMPDVVALSKPETYDTLEGVQSYLTTNKFQLVINLQAFTIWRRGK